MINSLPENVNNFYSVVQNYKLTSAEDEKCSKAAKSTLYSLCLGALSYVSSRSYAYADKTSYIPSILSALGVATLGKSLLSTGSIKDYYNPAERSRMKSEATAGNIFQALIPHGLRVLDDKILTVDEVRQKIDDFPEPIVKVRKQLTNTIKEYQRSLEGIDFSHGIESVIKKRPHLLKNHGLYLEKIKTILETNKPVAALISTLTSISLQVDGWEKDHTVIDKGFFFSTSKLVIKDYHNADEIAKMRKEALSSDLFQILKAHGSLKRVLDAQILSLDEVKTKLENVPEEIKRLSPNSLTTLQTLSILKFFSLDTINNFLLTKSTEQGMQGLKGIPQPLAAKAKIYIESAQEVGKWESTHLLSSLFSY